MREVNTKVSTIRYLYDIEGITGFVKSGKTYHYVKDALRNVVAILDINKEVARYEYDAWGKCEITNDINGIAKINPIRWKSQYYDTESGMYYINKRYYSPVTKQYINASSPDSASLNYGNIYGLNLYLITNENTVNRGFECFTIDTSIPLVWEPDELTGWEYFWKIALPRFWRSKEGKILAISLFVFATIITYGAALTTSVVIGGAIAIPSGYITALAIGTGVLLAGSAIAGFAGMTQGNSFWDGFAYYINNNWAQSLAITSVLIIASVIINGAATAAKTECFKEGTKVLTESGSKPIEEIQVGDKVWAYDEETGEKGLKEVVRLFRNGMEFTKNGNQDIGEGVRDWIKVGVKKEKSNEELDLITCTFEHPFYVLNADSGRTTVVFEGKEESNTLGSWIASKDLKVGDKLLFSNGENGIISSVEIEHFDEPQTTYNFEVADFHTYYVGENGVLVHNTCPENILKNIEYTDKVKVQMLQDIDHGFPSMIVDIAGVHGKVGPFTGGDKVVRTAVELPGAINGRVGIYQYIIEPNGITVNHRLFTTVSKSLLGG